MINCPENKFTAIILVVLFCEQFLVVSTFRLSFLSSDHLTFILLLLVFYDSKRSIGFLKVFYRKFYAFRRCFDL